MTRLTLVLLLPFAFLFSACSDDDDPIAPRLEVPDTYAFDRAGVSTVDYSGQATRIAMAEELTAAMLNPDNTGDDLLAMFRNAMPSGGDVDPFTDPALNASDKSIAGKTAASYDYFFADASTSALVRADFEGWLTAQAAEVFPRWNELAAAGAAGQIPNGTRARYVSGAGLEYNQVFAKSLIGALMLDQTLNNYLSTGVLDAADNRATNDAGSPEDGKVYTTMEHKWDEAYGYVFGAAQDGADPLTTLGDDDSFLNEYVARVDQDPDYTGIADAIFRAFVRGRAAIVAGDYAERDAQVESLRADLSRVPAVRGIFYLMRGAESLENDGPAAAFHALSEAYGFVYSLQFTRNPATDAPYLDRAEVMEILDALVANNANGLWTVTPAVLRAQAGRIADAFGLTLAQAAE